MKPLETIILRIIFLGFLLALATSSQVVHSQTQHAAAPANLGKGAVVESISGDSEAQKAGLKQGDILLEWNSAYGQGSISSPLDLLVIEAELMPRGAVNFTGISGNEPHTWILHPGKWGISSRPNFSDGLLSDYEEGRALAQAGKIIEAAGCWREIDHRFQDVPSWLSAWLMFHSAELLAEKRSMRDADGAYIELIRASTGLPIRITGQFRLAWADTFQFRGDWSNADKYYRQQLIAASNAHDRFLTHLTLNKLGETARSHGNLRQAKSYYLRALGVAGGIGAGNIYTARTLNGLGNVMGIMRDLPKAEKYFHLALAIEEQLAPGSPEIAESLVGLGAVAADHGDPTKAEARYSRVMALLEQSTNAQVIRAKALIGIANVAWMRGNLPRAERDYSEALLLLEAWPSERLRTASSLTGLGNIAWIRGDLATAEDFYQQAFEIYKDLSPHGSQFADSLNNLALVIADRGDLISAENKYLEALAIQQQLSRESYAVSFLLENLGVIALERGDLARAQTYYFHALTIRKRISPGSMDVARSLRNLGDVALNQGASFKAWRYYQGSIAIEKRVAPNSLNLALTLRRLAQLDQSRGNLADARHNIQQALGIEEELAPNGLDAAETLNLLGSIQLAQGDLANAGQNYTRARVISEKVAAGTSIHAESLAGLATIMRRRNQLDDAAELFDKALNVFEIQTDHLGGGDVLRSGFRANHASYYEDYIEILLERKQPELAFQVMERARARSLLETLTTDSIDIRQGADPLLLEREKMVRQALAAQSNHRIHLLGSPHVPGQIDASEREIEALSIRYQQIEDEIRRSNSNYAELTHPRSLSIKEVQERLLDDDSLLLEYFLGNKHSYVWAVTSSSIAVYELPERTKIEKVAQRVYDLLTAETPRLRGKNNLGREKYWTRIQQSYQRESGNLSHMVLDPVANRIAEKRRLLVVADGSLQYVPFAAVPVPRFSSAEKKTAPLLAKHEVINLPSISVLDILRKEEVERIPAGRTVLVFADPVFSEHDSRVQLQKNQSVQVSLAAPLHSVHRGGGRLDFPRLLFSRQEAKAIEQITPPGKRKIILDFDANREAVLGPELAQYRIIHFATHGIFDGEHPELSGLVLSLVDRQGRPQNGFLSLQEIYNLKLPTELIVLSACKTALGKPIKGEGLIGLTRAFMYAGASHVAASLWNVDDAATAELMKYFYKAMEQEQMPPGAALRKAQMQMWRQKRFQDPYYWAGFVIQGDWR